MPQARSYLLQNVYRGAIGFGRNGLRIPGVLVGVIAVRPQGLPADKYNPLVIKWTANPYRKDLEEMIENKGTRRHKLHGYNRDLFNSMFKNW